MKRCKFLSVLPLVLLSVWTQAQVYLSEDFETGQKPEGWNNEYVSGNEPWRYRNGGHSPNDSNWDVPADEYDITRNPQTAYEGTYNAIFFKQSPNFETTRLITPEMNVAGATSLQLSFYLCQITWNFGGSPGTDELRVYYKTSAEGEWVLLQEYTDPVWEWEYQQISLPEPSETYYVAFEGRTRWGYGTCIDNVVIEETGSTPMYIGDIDFEQPFANYVPSGATNVPMMRVDFNVFGNTDSVQLTEIHVTSANDSDTDLAANGVKLYYTLSQTFQTDHPLGSATGFSEGRASFTGLGQTLPQGHSYVWLTCDVDPSASHGNQLDMQILTGDIATTSGSYPESDQDPPGYRAIYQSIYMQDFEGAHGWDLLGEFEVGTPDGSGGNPGNPNPVSAFGGNRSLGTDLSGTGANPYAYEPGLTQATADMATSPVIQALYYKNLNLFYHRYINVEWADSANILVSNDGGSTWNTFWTKGENQLADYNWSQNQIVIPDRYARSDQLQLRFRMGPTNEFGNYSGWHIDDLFLTGEFISKDVGVSRWIAPLGGSGHTATEEVVVRISNYGGADILDPVPVAYSFDGGENWTVNQMDTDIPVGGSVDFTFPSRADLTEPGYRPSVLAKTLLPGDQYSGNDQFSTEIYLVPTYVPPYAEDLEQDDGYWQAGGAGLWQHGDPGKSTINAAWSGSNCWVTSLSARYGNVLSTPYQLVFEDNFETDLGWSFSYEFERNIPNRDHVPYNAHSNSLYCIGTDLSGQGGKPYLYENGISEASPHTATSPPIDVSSYSDLQLSFYSWMEVTGGDSVRIEASADNGVTWQTLWKNQEGEIWDWDFSFMEVDIPDELSYTDQLRIRFSLYYSSASGITGSGWNIDDLEINGSYIDSAPATLTSPAFDLTGINAPMFTARLWVDTEEYADGATLEYSLDDGQTWSGITNASGYDSYWNWYTGQTVSALGTNGWSGQTGGWISVRHLLPASLLNKDRVRFRLKFMADKSNNLYDGIAMDDIRIMEAPPNLDLLDILSPSSTCELPENQTFSLSAINNGASAIGDGDTLLFTYHIERDGDIQTGEEAYVVSGAWNKGVTRVLNMTEPFDFSISGDYQVRVCFKAEDPHFYSPLSSDTLEALVRVEKPYVELGEDISTTRPDTVLLRAHSGVGGQSYLWQDGSSDSTFQVSAEGTYYVRVSNPLGCTDSDTVRVLELVADVGITAYLGPDSDCELGTGLALEMTVMNLGTDTIESGETLYVGARINGAPAFEDAHVVSGRFRPGDSFDHTSSSGFDFSLPGDYELKLYTRLDRDEESGNDTLEYLLQNYGYPDSWLGPDTVVSASSYLLEPGSGYAEYEWQDLSTGETFMVNEPGLGQYYVTITDQHGCTSSDTVAVDLNVDDLELEELLSPSTSCELSENITVSARVRNAGNQALEQGTALDLVYSIDGGAPVRESTTLSQDLLPGHSFDFTFSSTENVSTGQWYDFSVFVDYADDSKRHNDTIETTVGIFEMPALDLGEDYQLVLGTEHTLDAGPGFLSYEWQDGSNLQTYTITQPGIGKYSVTVTDGNGCTAYDEVEVLLAVPDIGILSVENPVTRCRMDSQEQVQLNIKNYGNWDIEPTEEIYVSYTVNGSEETTERLLMGEALGAGDTLLFTFSKTEDFSQPGNYDIYAYTTYDADQIATNDMILKSAEHFGSPLAEIENMDDSAVIYVDTTLVVTPGYPSYVWQDGSTGTEYPITEPSAGWYAVTVTGENGCETRDSVFVAYDLPDLEIIALAEPLSGCELGPQTRVGMEIRNNGFTGISTSDTIVLAYSVDGGSSVLEQFRLESELPWGASRVLWLTETYDFSTPGNYRVRSSLIYKPDQNTGNNLLITSIDHWPDPVVEINNGADTVKGSLPATLDAGAGFSSYLWKDQSTTSSIQAGTYGPHWVVVTDQNGCSGSDTIYVASITSTEEKFTDIPVSIYPNPVSRVLHIRFEGEPARGLILEMYSVSNALVYRKDLKDTGISEAEVNVQTLSPGAYMLRIYTENETLQRMILVE